MPQKSNNDSKEKYHYVREGTLAFMRVIDILIKKAVFVVRGRVLEYEKDA